MSLQSQGWASAMCVPRLAAGSGRREQQCQQAVSHPTALVFARPGWGSAEMPLRFQRAINHCVPTSLHSEIPV